MRDYYARNDLLLVFEKDKLDISQLAAMKAALFELSSNIHSNEAMLAQIELEIESELPTVVAQSVTVSNPVYGGLKESFQRYSCNADRF